MQKEQTPAQAIKKELSKLFPGIKFNCRYETFSGGDSVEISRKHGPSVREIDKVTSKYKYGNFDGMQDIYNYDNCNNSISQSKYISNHRNIDSQTFDAMYKSISLLGFNNLQGWEQEKLIYNLYYNTSFPSNNIEVIGVKKNPDFKNGILQDYFTIDYKVIN